MGDKQAARRLMTAAGVPAAPGYDGDDQADGAVQAAAEKVGWPVMIKPARGAAARACARRGADGFLDLLQASRREARPPSGDRVVLERFVERPRHWRCRCSATPRADVLHLFERECSIQRRHLQRSWEDLRRWRRWIEHSRSTGGGAGPRRRRAPAPPRGAAAPRSAPAPRGRRRRRPAPRGGEAWSMACGNRPRRAPRACPCRRPRATA